MTKKELVEEILLKVLEKLGEGEDPNPSDGLLKLGEDSIYRQIRDVRKLEESRPKSSLLVVCKDEKGASSLEILQNPDVLSSYKISYSYEENQGSDPDDHDYILILDMDMEAVAKTTSGIYDTPYLRLIARTIMEGKKAFVLKDAIEIFKYVDRAPKGFISLFRNKVETLKEWNLLVRSEDQILRELLSKKKRVYEGGRDTLVVEKRALSGRDVKEAYLKGYVCIATPKNCQVTSVAKDYLKDFSIELINLEK